MVEATHEFQALNVLSTAGASILGIGYLIPMVYFVWSLKYGPRASENPWGAAGLEWQIQSPPTTFNFDQDPDSDKRSIRLRLIGRSRWLRTGTCL
jgi:cytochrome c oxidase subunit I